MGLSIQPGLTRHKLTRGSLLVLMDLWNIQKDDSVVDFSRCALPSLGVLGRPGRREAAFVRRQGPGRRCRDSTYLRSVHWRQKKERRENNAAGNYYGRKWWVGNSDIFNKFWSLQNLQVPVAHTWYLHDASMPWTPVTSIPCQVLHDDDLSKLVVQAWCAYEYWRPAERSRGGIGTI